MGGAARPEPLVEALVWIRGHRLRDVRAAAGRRLVDVANGIMHAATLSRLETHGRKAIPLAVAVALVQRLGIPIQTQVSPSTWARALVDQAVAFLEQSRIDELLRALWLRDLVVVPIPAATSIEAQILTAWAEWLLGDPQDPDHMRTLQNRARESGAVRPALWAEVFEAVMRARAGDTDTAVRIAADAATVAEHDGEPADVLVARAAWGRLTAKQGIPENGLAIVNAVCSWVSASTPYGQARFLYVRGLLEAVAGRTTDAEGTLRSATKAAVIVPNLLLAAYTEAVLAKVYESRGEADGADAASLRSARYYANMGRVREAMGVLTHALARVRRLPADEIEGSEEPIVASLPERTGDRGILDGALTR
jgi:hypothetical protein